MATASSLVGPPSYLRGALVLLLAQALTLIGALVANVLSARALGPSGRGQLALVLQASYFLAVVALVGRDRAYPAASARDRGLAEALGDQLRLAGVPAVLTLFAASAYAIAAFGDMPSPFRASGSLVVLTLGACLARLVRGASIASASTRPVMVAAIVSQASLLLALLVLVFLGVDDSATWAAVYAGTGVAPYMWLLVRRARVTEGAVAPVRRLGLRIYPASLAEVALMRLDRLLLPVFASFSGLGVYVVIATMTELASWPAQQYSDSKVPVWSRVPMTRKTIWHELGRVLVGTVGLACPGALVIWFAIGAVFGSGFESGKQLVLPLSIVAVCVGVYRLSCNLSAIAGSARASNAIAVAGFVNAVVAYPLLISADGTTGAAWASAIGLGSSAAAGLSVLWRDARAEREDLTG